MPLILLFLAIALGLAAMWYVVVIAGLLLVLGFALYYDIKAHWICYWGPAWRARKKEQQLRAIREGKVEIDSEGNVKFKK